VEFLSELPLLPEISILQGIDDVVQEYELPELYGPERAGEGLNDVEGINE
jgi:hypothetical protein